jgi:hypothetical protein
MQADAQISPEHFSAKPSVEWNKEDWLRAAEDSL